MNEPSIAEEIHSARKQIRNVRIELTCIQLRLRRDMILFTVGVGAVILLMLSATLNSIPVEVVGFVAAGIGIVGYVRGSQELRNFLRYEGVRP